ncbi:MAG: ParB N-terminal domain-containing protein [Nitratireductor sp.]|nr:ParB N-terminal domain-containing protein [Nitratireductor sp.]
MPTLKIEYLSPKELKPHPRNARTHSPKQVRQLKSSIEQFGFINPIVINKEIRILNGHGRAQAAIQLGLKLVC